MLNSSRKYRYPGIRPFTEEQQHLFFGRNDDINNLISLIFLEKLIVLFGKSGYGKSSLINAGLIPKILQENQKGKKSYQSYIIRFQPYSDGNVKLIDKFIFNLSKKETGSVYEKYSFLPRTVWGELKRRQTVSSKSFVLFFDQFEEFFTYQKQDQSDFIRQIADLLYSDMPEYLDKNEDIHTKEEVELMIQKLDVRIIFSIRSDRISELDKFKDTLPVILNKRYELKPLKASQAREALIKPAKLEMFSASENIQFESAKFQWTPEAIETAIDSLLNESKSSEVGIESFQLQILAQNIESKVITGEIYDRNNDGLPDVLKDDLPSISNLYENFYENSLKNLSVRDKKLSQTLIEKGLIFEDDNQRINIHEKLIAKNYKVDSTLIGKLVDLRLVRAENSTSGGYNIELSHDSFVKPILISAQKRKNRRIKNIALVGTSFSVVLSIIIISTFYFFKSPTANTTENELIEKNVSLSNVLDSLSITLVKAEESKQELNIKIKKFETKFDSIKTIESEEDSIKQIIRNYIECINRRDVKCLSNIVADKMDRYYTVTGITSKEREKLERQYFNRYPMENITSITDIIVKTIDSTQTYTATAFTIYNYRDKGETPMVYKFKLNKDFRVSSLTSYIQRDK